jgi:signal transduction histidine kinase
MLMRYWPYVYAFSVNISIWLNVALGGKACSWLHPSSGDMLYSRAQEALTNCVVVVILI